MNENMERVEHGTCDVCSTYAAPVVEFEDYSYERPAYHLVCAACLEKVLDLLRGVS